jgi:type II secretory pathway pseudopilin PulG
MRSSRRARGFTYIGVLLAVALCGVGLAAAGQSWHTAVKRSKERDLQFAGAEFRRALESYYAASPGGTREFPRNLQDLLLDPRHPVTRRHLRRIYVDPVTGRAEWGVILEAGRIVGVHSLSRERPFRGRAARYADWQFVAGRP